jgi:hypothetical protein
MKRTSGNVEMVRMGGPWDLHYKGDYTRDQSLSDMTRGWGSYALWIRESIYSLDRPPYTARGLLQTSTHPDDPTVSQGCAPAASVASDAPLMLARKRAADTDRMPAASHHGQQNTTWAFSIRGCQLRKALVPFGIGDVDLNFQDHDGGTSLSWFR